MIVKPGGLVTVTQQLVFDEDFRRKLEGHESSDFLIEVSNAEDPPSPPNTYPFLSLSPQCWAGNDYTYLNSWEMATNKDGSDKNKTAIAKPGKPDKRNKTDNAKPDKAARPGGKLDLLFDAADGDIILRSASIKPNNFQPRYVCLKWGRGRRRKRKKGEGGRRDDKRAFRILLTFFFLERQ